MLPNEFKERMKLLLKDEYQLFLDTFNESNVKGFQQIDGRD